MQVVRKNKVLQLSTLGLISIGMFVCTGVGIVASMAVFWFLGSVLGGLATLELGWMIRMRLDRRVV